MMTNSLHKRLLHAFLLQSLFRFAYTDPSKDLDVSRFMDTKGAVELSITRVSSSGLPEIGWWEV